MRYIKILLTVIALLLALNLFKSVIVPVAQGSGVTDVNIAGVAGQLLFDKTIPVKIIK